MAFFYGKFPTKTFSVALVQNQKEVDGYAYGMATSTAFLFELLLVNTLGGFFFFSVEVARFRRKKKE